MFVSQKINKKMKTLYQKWAAGEIGNFGMFQTTIFKAYQIADEFNREKLNDAYPGWFVTKTL
jgi:hypothetical protein